MGVLSKLGKGIGHIIDYRVDRWISWGSLKTSFGKTKSLATSIFLPQQPGEPETFSQARARLKLSEADLIIQCRELTKLIYVFLFLAVAVFCYGIYSLLIKNLIPFLASISIMLYCLAHAFKYHFWRFQIRQKELGISISRWFHKGLLRQN